jgi:hypothetical protein
MHSSDLIYRNGMHTTARTVDRGADKKNKKNAKMTAITARNAFCDTRSMEQQGYGDDWVDSEFKLFLDGSLEIRSASHQYLR